MKDIDEKIKLQAAQLLKSFDYMLEESKGTDEYFALVTAVSVFYNLVLESFKDNYVEDNANESDLNGIIGTIEQKAKKIALECIKKHSKRHLN